jgi:hypothetical protein
MAAVYAAIRQVQFNSENGRAANSADRARRIDVLAFGTGVGSELRRPLGITIIGGLIASQLLTLYTTPVVYLYFDRVQRWWDRVRGV